MMNGLRRKIGRVGLSLGWGCFWGFASAQTARSPGTLAQIKTMPEVLRALGADAVRESGAIELGVPELVDHGAVVPVTVRSVLPKTDQITLLVAANPAPWVATYDLFPSTEPLITMRIKMSQSSEVVALVRAEGRFYAVRRPVRVTLGGCGAS